jgi:hypothetical protein
MTNRIFAPSYQRGLELIAGGCPLDYVSALPDRPVPKSKLFRARQLEGYTESRVYSLGPLETRYVIGLHLGTDRPAGTIITDWTFNPPWPDHQICWDCEPAGIIPKRHLGDYGALLNSHLMEVLNDHRLLRRGCPVQGLLCGCAFQPIPAGSRDVFVSAKLTLFDEFRNPVVLRINLVIVRTAWSTSRTVPRGAGRARLTMAEIA